MSALSCACPGCGAEEKAEEALNAAPQSRAEQRVVAATLAKDEDEDEDAAAWRFVLEAALPSSSEERMAPNLVLERLTVAEGESTAMVSGRMRGWSGKGKGARMVGGIAACGGGGGGGLCRNRQRKKKQFLFFSLFSLSLFENRYLQKNRPKTECEGGDDCLKVCSRENYWEFRCLVAGKRRRC